MSNSILTNIPVHKFHATTHRKNLDMYAQFRSPNWSQIFHINI
jgi:hypothetical protein